MTSRAWKCPADLIRWQKSVDVHQNPAHTSPTHLSTHSYPTLISKKHHMLTSREKCGLDRKFGYDSCSRSSGLIATSIALYAWIAPAWSPPEPAATIPARAFAMLVSTVCSSFT